MKNRAVIVLCVIAAAFVFCAGCGAGSGDPEDRVETTSVGEWIKISKVAEADKKQHDAKVKVTKIVTDEKDAIDMIEEYNLSGVSETVVTDQENDKVGFAVCEYDVKFGDDFPEAEFGITDVTVPIAVTGQDGSETIEWDGEKYDGLSAATEIGSLPQGYDFYKGDTYHGKAAFLIPKDCDTYLIRITVSGNEDDGDAEYVYVDPAS